MSPVTRLPWHFNCSVYIQHATASNYCYRSLTKKECIIQSLVMTCDQYVTRGQQCGQLRFETNFNFIWFELTLL